MLCMEISPTNEIQYFITWCFTPWALGHSVLKCAPCLKMRGSCAVERSRGNFHSQNRTWGQRGEKKKTLGTACAVEEYMIHFRIPLNGFYLSTKFLLRANFKYFESFHTTPKITAPRQYPKVLISSLYFQGLNQCLAHGRYSLNVCWMNGW